MLKNGRNIINDFFSFAYFQSKLWYNKNYLPAEEVFETIIESAAGKDGAGAEGVCPNELTCAMNGKE